MSAIIDKYIINNVEYDRRVKLTVEDKQEIKTVYMEISQTFFHSFHF